ncbi:MAG: hypothetical protein DHS20C16_05360 [Phycisphaerae bacterium]|nr:MAG: hypothetical protein DHS20C16_05360 [Phycisphaerae bacterium]
MPRTNVIVRKSRLSSFLVVLILLPIFWLLVRTVVLMVSVAAIALLSMVWPGLLDFDRVTLETFTFVVTTVLVGICLVIFFCDFRRQPITPDGRYCAACGYDLTGNTSGICPECGDSV